MANRQQENDDLARCTNAVFTSTKFDRTFPENSDSDPPPGKDLAKALEAAFVQEGVSVVCSPRDGDPKNQWWEHSYWFFFLTWKAQTYFIQIECIPDGKVHGDYWRVALSRKMGCLWSLFGGGRRPLPVDGGLRALTERLICRLGETSGLRWVDDQEAEKLWA